VFEDKEFAEGFYSTYRTYLKQNGRGGWRQMLGETPTLKEKR
jgi:hypothetical protein